MRQIAFDGFREVLPKKKFLVLCNSREIGEGAENVVVE